MNDKDSDEWTEKTCVVFPSLLFGKVLLYLTILDGFQWSSTHTEREMSHIPIKKKQPNGLKYKICTGKLSKLRTRQAKRTLSGEKTSCFIRVCKGMTWNPIGQDFARWSLQPQ